MVGCCDLVVLSNLNDTIIMERAKRLGCWIDTCVSSAVGAEGFSTVPSYRWFLGIYITLETVLSASAF